MAEPIRMTREQYRQQFGQEPPAPAQQAQQSQPTQQPVRMTRAQFAQQYGEIPMKVYDAAKRNNVNPSLAMAMARAESNNNPQAVSPAGAVGVMQLMPATAKELGVDPFDPDQNIEGGVRYIKSLLERSGNDIDKALEYYNFGMDNVDAGKPLPNETVQYKQRIKEYMGIAQPQQPVTLDQAPNPAAFAPQERGMFAAIGDAKAQERLATPAELGNAMSEAAAFPVAAVQTMTNGITQLPPFNVVGNAAQATLDTMNPTTPPSNFERGFNQAVTSAATEGNAAKRVVAGGALDAGMAFGSTLATAMSDRKTADQIAADKALLSEVSTETDKQNLGPVGQVLRPAAQNAASTFIQSGVSGTVGGFPAIMAQMMTTTYDDGLRQGQASGLQGEELVNYARRQSLYEGAVMGAFQAAGLPGLEKLPFMAASPSAIQGIKTSLAPALKRTLLAYGQELPEETITWALQTADAQMSNVGEKMTTGDYVKQWMNLALETGLSVGASRANDIGRGVRDSVVSDFGDAAAQGIREAGQEMQDAPRWSTVAGVSPVPAAEQPIASPMQEQQPAPVEQPVAQQEPVPAPEPAPEEPKRKAKLIYADMPTEQLQAMLEQGGMTKPVRTAIERELAKRAPVQPAQPPAQPRPLQTFTGEAQPGQQMMRRPQPVEPSGNTGQLTAAQPAENAEQDAPNQNIRRGRDEKYGIDVEMRKDDKGYYVITESDENSSPTKIEWGMSGIYRNNEILNMEGEFVSARQIIQGGGPPPSPLDAYRHPVKTSDRAQKQKIVDLVAEMEFARRTGDMKKADALEAELQKIVETLVPWAKTPATAAQPASNLSELPAQPAENLAQAGQQMMRRPQPVEPSNNTGQLGQAPEVASVGPSLTSWLEGAGKSKLPQELTPEELQQQREETGTTVIQDRYLFHTSPIEGLKSLSPGTDGNVWMSGNVYQGQSSGDDQIYAIDRTKLDPTLFEKQPNGYPVYKGEIPADAVTPLGARPDKPLTDTALQEMFVKASQPVEQPPTLGGAAPNISKHPSEMLQSDLVTTGKPSPRVPKGLKFIGELYEPDFAGSIRKPTGPNALPIGNIFKNESGKYVVLEMNNGWTGRSIPGEFEGKDFEHIDTTRLSASQSVKSYKFKKPDPDLAPTPTAARQSALSTAAQNLAAIEGKAEPVVSEGQNKAFDRLVGKKEGGDARNNLLDDVERNSEKYVTAEGQSTPFALDKLTELLAVFGKNSRRIAKKIVDDDFSIKEYDLLVANDKARQEAFEAADDAWNFMGTIWRDNKELSTPKITRDSALIMPYARTEDTITWEQVRGGAIETPTPATPPTPTDARQSALSTAAQANDGDAFFDQKELDEARVEKFKSRERLVYMSPDEFLSMAKEGEDSHKTQTVEEVLSSGNKFSSIPFLSFKMDGKGGAVVDSHEGRHRARALKARGVKKMPVIIESVGSMPVRWSEQSNKDSMDYYQGVWPTELTGETGAKIAFPVSDPRQPPTPPDAPIEIVKDNDGTWMVQRDGETLSLGHKTKAAATKAMKAAKLEAEREAYRADEQRRREEVLARRAEGRAIAEKEREKAIAEAPVYQRVNGWEIVKHGIEYVSRDPVTKEEVYAGKLSRVREVANESAPDTAVAPEKPKPTTTKTYETPEGYIQSIIPVIKQMLEVSNAPNVIAKAAGRKLSRNDEIAVVSEWVKDMRSKGEMALPTDFAGISEEQAYFLEPILKKLSLTPDTKAMSVDDVIGKEWMGRNGEKRKVVGPAQGRPDGWVEVETDGSRFRQILHADEIENEIKLDTSWYEGGKAQREKEAARESEEKAKTAEREKNFSSYIEDIGASPLQRGKLKAALLGRGAARKASRRGKVYRGPRDKVVEQMVEDGYRPASEEVPAIKELSGSQYNRMDNEQQAEFERRKAAAGTKTEYLLKDDNGEFVVTKAEHDYAVWLVNREKQTPQPVEQPEQSNDLQSVEIAPSGEVKQSISHPRANENTTPKQQKEYLLEELDALESNVPYEADLEKEQKYALDNMRRKLQELDKVKKRKGEHETEFLQRVQTALNEVRDAEQYGKSVLPYVTIKVPGDGVFSIIATKEKLKAFKAVAEKFPTTKIATNEPKVDSSKASAAPRLSKPKNTDDVVKQLSVFASKDPIRSNLNFVSLQGDRAAATDGHRMVVVSGNFPGSHDAPKSVLASKNKIDDPGNFPNIDMMFPTKNREKIGKYKTEYFWHALQQSMSLGDGNGKYETVTLILNPDDTIGFLRRVPDEGENSHNVQEGGKVLQSFNGYYLIDIVEHLRKNGYDSFVYDAPAFNASNGRYGAGYFTSPDGAIKHILMPIREYEGGREYVIKGGWPKQAVIYDPVEDLRQIIDAVKTFSTEAYNKAKPHLQAIYEFSKNAKDFIVRVVRGAGEAARRYATRFAIEYRRLGNRGAVINPFGEGKPSVSRSNYPASGEQREQVADTAEDSPYRTPQTAMVRMIQQLLGKNPEVVKRFPRKPERLGVFMHGVGEASIRLRADIAIGELVSKHTSKSPFDEQEKSDFLDAVAEELGVDPEQVVVTTDRERSGNRTTHIMNAYLRDEDYAGRVMAHELGHLIDYLPDGTLSRGNVLGRIAKLQRHFKTSMAPEPESLEQPFTKEERAKWRKEAAKEASADYGPFEKGDERKGFYTSAYYRYRLIREAENRELLLENTIKSKLMNAWDEQYPGVRDELKALTHWWNPFDAAGDPKYTEYRYSAKELYADAMSVLLNNPQAFKMKAPEFSRGFFAYLERNPEVKALYDQIQKELHDETFDSNTLDSIYSMQRRGEEVRKKKNARENPPISKIMDEFWHSLKVTLVERFSSIKRTGDPNNDPRAWLSEMRYLSSSQHGFVRSIETDLMQPLRKAGLDENDLGVYMLLRRTSSERKYLFNPLGLTEGESKKMLGELEQRLGAEQFKALEDAAETYHKLREEYVFPILEESRMFTPELLKLIKDNRNYATFNVQKYITEFYSSKSNADIGTIFKQIGTLDDVENVYQATILKDLALMRQATKNKAKLVGIEVKRELGEVEDAVVRRGPGGRIRYEEPKDPDKAIMRYSLDGKIQAVVIDKEIASLYERNVAEMSRLVKVIQLFIMPQRAMLTSWDPSFGPRAFFKDVLGSYKNMPNMSFWKHVQSFYMTRRDASIDVFYKGNSELVRFAYKNNLLIPNLNIAMTKGYVTLNEVKEGKEADYETEYERLMWYHALNAEGHPNKNMLLRTMSRVKRGIEDWNVFWDRWSKYAATYRMLNEGYFEREGMQASERVRRGAGTPDALAGGTHRLLMNGTFLFSNINIQGWSATKDAIKEQKFKYFLKVAMLDIAPKLLMRGFQAGMVGYLLGLDEEDDWLRKFYNTASDYDLANYNIIPLGIDKSGQAVGVPVPSDHTGMFFGALTWAATRAMNNESYDLGEIGRAVEAQLPATPSNVSWPISMASDLVLMATGRSPYDAWLGKQAIDRTAMEAGVLAPLAEGDVPPAVIEAAKYEWNKYFGQVYTFKDQPAKDAMFDQIGRFPVVGPALRRYVRASDRGIEQRLRREEAAVDAKRAYKSYEIGTIIKEELKKAGKNGNRVKTFREVARQVKERELLSPGYEMDLVSRRFNAAWTLMYGTPEQKLQARASNAVIKEMKDNR